MTILESLLLRHGADDCICISAAKAGDDGKMHVVERFVSGAAEAAEMIQRNLENPKILALWTNLQRLKPGADRRVQANIEAYTHFLVDIDRRQKKVNGLGAYSDDKNDPTVHKCNATEEEKAVLFGVAQKVHRFLKQDGSFGEAVVADSGNGYHLSWPLRPLGPAAGKQSYAEILAILKAKFESPELNVEIDASLADETQVVTVWGTWNRKYPGEEGRPQRQSQIVSVPKKAEPLSEGRLDSFIMDNKALLPLPVKAGDGDRPKADEYWLENYGVEDWFEWAHPYLDYEGSGSYERNGEMHHPSSTCPCHDEDGLKSHSTGRHFEVIVWPGGGIGVKCFSSEMTFGQVVAKINKLKGENYPHRMLAEDNESVLESVLEFAEEADDGPVAREAQPGETVRVDGAGQQYVEEGGNQVPVAAPSQAPPAVLVPLGAGEVELAGGTPKGGKKRLSLITVRASDVTEEPIEWLWPDKVPKGEITLFAGPAGCGKSNIAMDLIARITTGAEWPDGSPNGYGPMEALVFASEDSAEKVLRPRLRAAGADLSRVHIAKRVQVTAPEKLEADEKRKFKLKSDLLLLKRTLRNSPNIQIVFLDPITSYFGDVDPNKDKEMRPLLEDAQEMLRASGASILGVIHHSKRTDADSLQKIKGAGSITEVARAAWAFQRDPDNRQERLMSFVKGSYAEKEVGMKFRLASAMLDIQGKQRSVSKVEWLGENAETGDDVISRGKGGSGGGQQDDSGKRTACAKWLAERLGSGAVESTALFDEGMAFKFSKNTLYRAKGDLGIKAYQKSGQWHWAMPGEPKITEQEVM